MSKLLLLNCVTSHTFLFFLQKRHTRQILAFRELLLPGKQFSKDSTEKLLQLINKFSKIKGYKIYESQLYFYTISNYHIKKTSPILIASKRIKYLGIELPIDPAKPLLDIYLKEMKTSTRKDMWMEMICMIVNMGMLTAALFAIVKIWKQPKCPLMDEWRKWILYTQRNSATKKEGNLAICNNTQDPAGIMLSEVSQTKTD